MANLVPFGRYGGSLRPMGDLYSFVDDFFNTPLPQASFSERSAFKMDVEETEDGYVIEADLPGIDPDDVDIELNEGRLNISVKKEDSKEVEEKNYIHRERMSYSATRGVYLKDANIDGVNADLADGVLRIEVPKVSEKQNVRKIAIGSADRSKIESSDEGEKEEASPEA